MNKYFYIFSKDHHLGPFDSDDILEMMAKGEISRKTLLWKEGMPNWAKLETISELKNALKESSSPPDLPLENKDLNHPPDVSSIHLPSLPPIEEGEKIFPKKESEQVLASSLTEVPPPFEFDHSLEKRSIEEISPPDIPLPTSPIIKDEIGMESKLHKRVSRRRKKKRWKVNYYKKIEKNDELQVSSYQLDHGIPVNIRIFLFIFFLSLGLLFVKISLDISNPQPTYEDLFFKDFKRLQTITHSLSKKKVLMGIALGKKDQKVWLSSNRKGPYSLILQFSSIEGKILGDGNVVFSGDCLLLNHWCQLERIKINEGQNLKPGYYKVKMKGFYQKEKEGHFNKVLGLLNLSNQNSLGKRTFFYENDFLLYQGIPSHFLKELKLLKKKVFEKNVAFYREKIEELKTLKALTHKMMALYRKVLSEIRVGRKISRFEGKYAVIIGPLLRELILDNKEKFEMMKEKDLERSKYYRKIFSYGRKVGSLASDMVVRTSKIKKISRRAKLRLLKSFRLKVNNVVSLGNKNIKELENLVRLSAGR